jgi:hypothetical protein
LKASLGAGLVRRKSLKLQFCADWRRPMSNLFRYIKTSTEIIHLPVML